MSGLKTSILLSENKDVYHPGDKLSGLVQITASANVDVSRILVSFKSTLFTHIMTQRVWDSQANFKKFVTCFEREVDVFKGEPYKTLSGNHEWPFEFQIPEQAERHESQEFMDKKSQIFDDDADQELAPALAEVTSKGYQSSGNSYAVYYPLKVTILTGRTTDGKSEEFIENINVQPRREQDHPSWRTTTSICKFQTAVGAAAAKAKSKPSILRRLSSNTVQPNFNFSLSARIAGTAIIGRPIPIFLSLDHDSELPRDAIIPRFEIKSITASLFRETVIRAQGSGQTMYLSGSPEWKWDDTIPFGTKLAMPIPIERGDTLDLRTIVTDLFIPATESPSFLSFSIVILHSLKLKIDLTCDGQPFTASFSTKRLVLLSQYASSDAVERTQSYVESYETDRNDSFVDATPGADDAPPPFEAHDRDDVLPRYTRDGTY